ncbi:MAG: cache domain-containing protein [Thermodesulfobacteriota bacterium]
MVKLGTYIQEKRKVITFVTLTISFICLIFSISIVRHEEREIERLIAFQEGQSRNLVRVLEETFAGKYKARMHSFVNSPDFLSRRELLEAFARKDREDLLRISKPFAKTFAEEDPYFYSMGWFTKDNKGFLRMHKTELFGDDVSAIRHDIVSANKTLVGNSGYFVGKSGLCYRIVEPVILDGKHLGALQFRFNEHFFLQTLKEQFGITAFQVIPLANFKKVKYKKIPHLVAGDFAVQSFDIQLVAAGNENIDWSRERQRIRVGNKTYVLNRVYTMLSYQGNPVGSLHALVDISNYVAEQRATILRLVLISGLVILFASFFIAVSYNKLLKRIEGLNQALSQSNLQLEERIDGAANELKMLQGILPLCSYCKKIRSGKNSWEHVETYIQKYSEADISHGICPECAQKHFPKEYEDIGRQEDDSA